jgi:hypothetical protein
VCAVRHSPGIGQSAVSVAATQRFRMSPLRPNLFLIGAMKSGTTYLSELLGAHPAIFVSSPKEPCHFVDQKVLRRVWPGAWEDGYWRSVERYLSLFAGAAAASVITDASTFYSQEPLFSGVAERIFAFNPGARFVYIMRDPIERTISQYWHHVRWWGEHRPILPAIQSEPHYRHASHYARQLNAYLLQVGRDRVYVLTHEALLADPSGQLSRLYAWLGVDPSFRPAKLGVPNNVLPAVIHQRRDFGLLQRLRVSALYRGAARYIPRRVRNLGFSLIPTRMVRPRDVDTSEVERFLRPRYQRETEELGRLLNRTFPEWTTLNARD